MKSKQKKNKNFLRKKKIITAYLGIRLLQDLLRVLGKSSFTTYGAFSLVFSMERLKIVESLTSFSTVHIS